MVSPPLTFGKLEISLWLGGITFYTFHKTYMICLKNRFKFVRFCRHNVYFSSYTDAKIFMDYYGLSRKKYQITTDLLMLTRRQKLKYTRLSDYLK
jgi:hypothetical protein